MKKKEVYKPKNLRREKSALITFLSILGTGAVATSITLPIVYGIKHKTVPLDMVEVTGGDVANFNVKQEMKYGNLVITLEDKYADKTINTLGNVKIGDHSLESDEFLFDAINHTITVYGHILNKYEGKVQVIEPRDRFKDIKRIQKATCLLGTKANYESTLKSSDLTVEVVYDDATVAPISIYDGTQTEHRYKVLNTTGGSSTDITSAVAGEGYKLDAQQKYSFQIQVPWKDKTFTSDFALTVTRPKSDFLSKFTSSYEKETTASTSASVVGTVHNSYKGQTVTTGLIKNEKLYFENQILSDMIINADTGVSASTKLNQILAAFESKFDSSLLRVLKYDTEGTSFSETITKEHGTTELGKIAFDKNGRLTRLWIPDENTDLMLEYSSSTDKQPIFIKNSVANQFDLEIPYIIQRPTTGTSFTFDVKDINLVSSSKDNELFGCFYLVNGDTKISTVSQYDTFTKDTTSPVTETLTIQRASVADVTELGLTFYKSFKKEDFIKVFYSYESQLQNDITAGITYDVDDIEITCAREGGEPTPVTINSIKYRTEWYKLQCFINDEDSNRIQITPRRHSNIEQWMFKYEGKPGSYEYTIKDDCIEYVNTNATEAVNLSHTAGIAINKYGYVTKFDYAYIDTVTGATKVDKYVMTYKNPLAKRCAVSYDTISTDHPDVAWGTNPTKVKYGTSSIDVKFNWTDGNQYVKTAQLTVTDPSSLVKLYTSPVITLANGENKITVPTNGFFDRTNVKISLDIQQYQKAKVRINDSGMTEKGLSGDLSLMGSDPQVVNMNGKQTILFRFGGKAGVYGNIHVKCDSNELFTESGYLTKLDKQLFTWVMTDTQWAKVSGANKTIEISFEPQTRP